MNSKNNKQTTTKGHRRDANAPAEPPLIPPPSSQQLRRMRSSDASNNNSFPGSSSSSERAEDPHPTKSNNHRTLSLVPLSLMWLGLCTGLVLKDNNLILVFYAFCVSFALAALLRPVIPLVVVAASNAPADDDRTLKYLVGLIDCSVAMAILVLLPSSTTNASSSSSSSTTTSAISAEYVSLSVIAGYLAFDHWYSALHNCREKDAVISFCWNAAGAGGVIEDAATLISAVVILATNASDLVGQHYYRVGIIAWLVYKLSRLLLCLKFLTTRANIKPTTTAGTSSSSSPRRPVPLSEAVMSKALISKNKDSAAAAATSTTTAAADAVIREEKNPTDAAASTNYWIVHGVRYDLSDYIDQHPGGVEAIMLGKQRDCTALFQSYHPFTTRHVQVLQKYRIADNDDTNNSKGSDEVTELNGPNDIVASYKSRDPFYYMLCERVHDELQSKGIDASKTSDRTASWSRALYYVWILSAVILTGIQHCKGSIVGSFLFAVFGWLIGSLGHDAGHFCAFASPTLNSIGVWAMGLLCNPILWQHQHTYAHHSHTNEFDSDPDLHHFHTLIRVHRNFKSQDMYRLQSNLLYVIFAYTFVVFGTCVWIPWGVLKDGALYGMVEIINYQSSSNSSTNSGSSSSLLHGFGMLLHVILYVGIIVVVPFFAHATYLKALSAMVVHMTTSGLLFAFFSQINHINESSIQVVGGDSNKDEKKIYINNDVIDLETSWAAKQIETSNNFAPHSVLWHMLSNGLNLQIEHHLFPGVNHCHLHHIVPVVQRTCKEHGIEYKSYDNWCDIFNATLHWLDLLAGDDNAAT